MQRSSVWCLLAAIFLSGYFALTSRAEYSDRRQIIVFSAPASESGKIVQGSVDALRCQLIDRDTDVRFVDINELPDAGVTPTNGEPDGKGIISNLARLRSFERPDFELVLIGKDGGVKARTRNPGALQDFLALIDMMPMRRAELRSRGGDDAACDGRL